MKPSPQNYELYGRIKNEYLEICHGQRLISRFPLKGKIDLSGFSSNLLKLPATMIVRGSLILSGCKHLRVLPDNLCVMGDLYCDECTSLEYIPDNIFVSESLNLSACESLKKFPSISVDGHISVFGCSNAGAIPDDMIAKNGIKFNLSDVFRIYHSFDVLNSYAPTVRTINNITPYAFNMIYRGAKAIHDGLSSENIGELDTSIKRLLEHAAGSDNCKRQANIAAKEFQEEILLFKNPQTEPSLPAQPSLKRF